MPETLMKYLKNSLVQITRTSLITSGLESGHWILYLDLLLEDLKLLPKSHRVM
jgi:hypothetical protein